MWRSNWKIIFWKVFSGLLVLTIIANRVRCFTNNRNQHIYLTYADGLLIKVKLGLTVLEASKLNKIQHANLCGGKGRCTTCRVQLKRGSENAKAPSALELKALKRIGAPSNVRLACQLKPTHDLEIQLLVSPNCKPRDLHRTNFIPE